MQVTRREWLSRAGMGFGQLGLAGLLSNRSVAGSPLVSSSGPVSINPLAAKPPQFAPRAERVIHIFLNGGPSHIDTFDPKPKLREWDGKPLPAPNLLTERQTGMAFGSPFKFQRYGESGLEISELFADLGPVADELCVVRSMVADLPNHEPSLMLMNCGTANVVRPSMGSWLLYGLGSVSENLPGYVAMSPGGHPVKGPENWASAFLPSVYQGTFIDTKQHAIESMIANIRNGKWDPKQQRSELDLAQSLNRQFAARHEGEANLESRIASFEQAFRMQTAAAEAFDVELEPESVRQMYGDSDQARQILIARRLVERGVRFVQLWHGAWQPWDNHNDLEVNHRKLAGECSRAVGALIADLRQRGLLDSTLVILGGEFGRTPTVELDGSGTKSQLGRDHNHYGFSVVLAGGGVRGGHVHGATDEFGFQAVEDRVHVHDLHATILHLMGFDHTQLTYRHAGRDFRLTDVHGQVVRSLIA
ncbi:MAG: DUF1501 domain-containing protein [Pirellulales bacterium]